MDRWVNWFDLGRFGASLRVVPLSPLRGVAMTCLEVHDEVLFANQSRGDVTGLTGAQARERVEATWERLTALGFSRHVEVVREDSLDAETPPPRKLRMYSERTAFTLRDLQTVLPGLAASDFKLMPLEGLSLKGEVNSELAQTWKAFLQDVLQREAVDVWVPRANVFDVPYASARPLDAVWREVLGGRSLSRVVRGTPASPGCVMELGKARYRENALIAFYADRQAAQDAAQKAGQDPSDLEQVSLPYALPLWVEQDGRVVALRDVRFAPELMALEPQHYVGRTERLANGLVVELLRESRGVQQVYAEESQRWAQWASQARQGGSLDRDAVTASIRRAVEAHAAFAARFALADRGFGSGSQALLATPGVELGETPPPMRDLIDWGVDEYQTLDQCVQRFTESEGDDGFANLRDIDRRLREQEAEQAKALAREALLKVASNVRDSAGPEAAGGGAGVGKDTERVRHVDAGEKIGGARKDFHRRALCLEDLEGMNEHERTALVVKRNVWPPLDYEAMREAGVSPAAAVAIKFLKDSLGSGPVARTKFDGSPEEAYIEAIGVVRQAMASVKTLDDFAKACFDLHRYGAGDSNYIYGGSPFQVQIGSDASHLLHDAVAYGWRAEGERQPCVPSRIRSEVSKRVERAGEGREWSYLIKPKREKTDLEREAEAEKAEQDRELHRPHLERVERIGGQDWRAGRDIVAEDLLQHFGFRAVEFGNWLPQDERQTVLNMAFDSLCDLADALDLPPQGISLGGQLAVAFGSRGRGGKRAALAHFEPARNVINLTRMNGAGTLAHEWFHALDWSLGEHKRFLSDVGRPRQADDPMPGLVAAMKRRASTPQELLEKAQDQAQRGKEYAASWCWSLGEEARKRIGAVLDEWFERARAVTYDVAAMRFERLAPHEKNMARCAAPLEARGAVDYSRMSELEDDIVKAMRKQSDSGPAFTKVAKKVEANVHWMLAGIAQWSTISAANDLGVTLDERFLGGGANGRETSYLVNAKALDEKRSEPYWATDIELFARAGAQYVHYALEAKGVRSDYLVYGSDEGRHELHAVGNPNPTGQDRQALKPRFAALVDQVRMALQRSLDAAATVEP